jgi:hypothetical protein
MNGRTLIIPNMQALKAYAGGTSPVSAHSLNPNDSRP